MFEGVGDTGPSLDMGSSEHSHMTLDTPMTPRREPMTPMTPPPMRTPHSSSPMSMGSPMPQSPAKFNFEELNIGPGVAKPQARKQTNGQVDGAAPVDLMAIDHSNNPRGLRLELLAQSVNPEGPIDHVRKRFSDLVKVYKVEKHVLGRGHYGVVRRGRHRENGTEVAIKSVPKHKIRRLEGVRREIDILKRLEHPNIIKFHETFEDRRYIHIVMELCTGGELFDRIIDPKIRLEERDVAGVLKKILEAVSYLHAHNICHRDLKPENFLFTSDEIDAQLKMIDFGLSKQLESGEEHMRTRVGTAYYIAPEVLQRKYTMSCDLWSVGVVMYILLCGYPPFYGSTDMEVMARVRQGKFSLEGPDWVDVSEGAKDLIRSLLRLNPGERLTADQALQHPWIKNGGEQSRHVLSHTVVARLREYANHRMMKKIVLGVMSKNLSDKEIANLKDVFAGMDSEGTGQISLEQLQAGLHASGHHTSNEEVAALMRGIDIDGDGMISYHEFLAATMKRALYLQEEKIFWAFSRLDVEGTVFITVDDIASVLAEHNWSHHNVEEMLQTADLNNDGHIDYYEFLTLMRGDDDEQDGGKEAKIAGLFLPRF